MRIVNPLVCTFRMEKLDLKLGSCQAKSIGTVVSIAGALTVTLYKGLPLTSHMLPNNFLGATFLSSTQSEWLLGGFLLAAGNLCVSILLVIQVSKSYTNIMIYLVLGNVFGFYFLFAKLVIEILLFSL